MIIVLDFETAYSKEYSLSRMTTESYVRDPRFKVHGVGIQVDGDRPAVYFRDCHVATALKTLADRYPDAAYLMHNARFDAAILSWRYGIRPAFLLDTLSMARAVFPHESHSLANLSKLCGLGEKGKDLVNFLGAETLDDEQQKQMGEYCKNDVRLTWALYNAMKDRFNVSELKVIDRTLRMFTEPVLELDVPVLEEHLAKVQTKKAKVLGDYDLTSLRSNQQFADLLRARGVEPPMKMSLRTKKETYAFSKTDEGMLALLDHEDEEVQCLAAARLGVKSSIEETRTEAMLGIASRGALPVALNYFGAGNTGRFCLTGETHITVLRSGVVHGIFLQELQNDDLVWDGEAFVAHGGLVCNGEMEVMTYDGITGTPDHRVFCENENGNGKTVELREAYGRGLSIQTAPRAPRYPTKSIHPCGTDSRDEESCVPAVFLREGNAL